MAIIIKNKNQIKKIRESCHRLAEVLEKVSKKVAPGVSTWELDAYAKKLIEEKKDSPAFLNYKPYGAKYPYPASFCISVNGEVVHGIPKKDRILKEGDIVSLDGGIKHEGFFSDSAVTVPVGKISKKDRELLKYTEEALYNGIAEARAGNRVGDISSAVEKTIRPHKYGIVRELAGHGVGVEIHEDPYVPNYGKKGMGAILKAGMIIAIEPMINAGGAEVYLSDDGYTFFTADGSKSAHFEHTVLITDGDPEILTLWKK